jgi:hypothetical protein
VPSGVLRGLRAYHQTRYPVVERAVGEFRARSDRLYPSEVRANLKSLLRDTQKRETRDEPGQYEKFVLAMRDLTVSLLCSEESRRVDEAIRNGDG